MFESQYDSLEYRYKKNWCTIKQLATFVKLGAITAKQFEQITGKVLYPD